MGADDYLVKPVANMELVARVQAALRRSAGSTSSQDMVLVDGPLCVDRERRVVTVDGQELDLSGIEWRLLLTLTARPGAVVSAETLLEKVWNDPSGDNPEKVKFAVMRLRRVLASAGVNDSIVTLRSRGYRWVGSAGGAETEDGGDTADEGSSDSGVLSDVESVGHVAASRAGA